MSDINRDQSSQMTRASSPRAIRRWKGAAVVSAMSASLVVAGGITAGQDAPPVETATPGPSLEETRLTMDKWIETQQILSKERKDWQQGKEILVGRLELVKNEIASLEDKIKLAEAGVAEAARKRDDLVAENDQLKAVGAQLAEGAMALETDLRRLYRTLPEPVQIKLQPLHQRMPDDPTQTRISVAERFQNVLGILNELNKVNTEITVNYEVHQLAGGSPSEVQTIYVGLAQAYYVSASGEAGIGRPARDGWKWEPSKAVAGDVLMALEILQGKHSPAFIPLPVKLQ